jgi:CRISPR-associated protein Cmr3
VGLLPVNFLGDVPKGKPAAGPAFWRWSEFEPWLLEGLAPPAGFGVAALDHERRFHVAIDPQTGTAEDGKLFVSDGLRFWRPGVAGRLGLGFATGDGLSPRQGAVRLGGEGRISYLHQGGGGFPACPTTLLAALERSRSARVLLSTPGIFDGGAMPVARTIYGAKLIATLVDRPEVTSGWDHAKAEPKPSRRMAPAGSVYWVDLAGVGDVGAWLASAWGRPVREQTVQDRRDGFGIALVGVGQ